MRRPRQVNRQRRITRRQRATQFSTLSVATVTAEARQPLAPPSLLAAPALTFGDYAGFAAI